MPSKTSYTDVKKPDNSDRFLSSFCLPYIFIHPISSNFSSKQGSLLLWKAFFDVFIPLSFPDVLMCIPIMLIEFTPNDTSFILYFCCLLLSSSSLSHCVAENCKLLYLSSKCWDYSHFSITPSYFFYLLKPPLSLVPTSNLCTIFLIFVTFYFFKNSCSSLAPMLFDLASVFKLFNVLNSQMVD